jgi:CBS domain-containing protein
MATKRDEKRRERTGQEATPREASGEGGETSAWEGGFDEAALDAIEEDAIRAPPQRAKAAAPAGLTEEPRVDHMMTRDPIVITADARLERAAAEMSRASVRHLPVVDPDGRLIGILSDRDLRQTLGTDTHEWYRAAMDSLAETVENVMSADPIALPVGTGLEAALEIFADEGVGAIPIVDEDERVAGMLSYVDVLLWLERQLPHAHGPQPAP